MKPKIQEAYECQDASDMFFNSELVAGAYRAAYYPKVEGKIVPILLNTAEECSNLFAKKLEELFPGYGEIIAEDFLRRV